MRRHLDVHFRAQVLPSRKAYDEKHSDLGGRRGIGGVCMHREKDFSMYHEIPRKKSHDEMAQRSAHPATGMQRDTRNIKLLVSVATPRQVHLQGRDGHRHGVGVPTGGSQIGRQRYRARRERNSALHDVEIGLPFPKGEGGKEWQWEEGRSGHVKRKTQELERKKPSRKKPTSSQKQTQGAERDRHRVERHLWGQ